MRRSPARPRSATAEIAESATAEIGESATAEMTEASVAKHVGRPLGVVVDERVAVLAQIGGAAEHIATIVRLLGVLRVHGVATAHGQAPLVRAVPPDAAAVRHRPVD